MDECLASQTVPAPWPLVTSADYHRRRPGEPLGYVPEVGDRIRYALRHSRWCPAAHRMLDEHDERGPMGDAVTVAGAFERDGMTHYHCRDDRGDSSWIDLDWWIAEHVHEDGALW